MLCWSLADPRAGLSVHSPRRQLSQRGSRCWAGRQASGNQVPQQPGPASYVQLALGQQGPGGSAAAVTQLAAILGAAGLQLAACAQLASSWQGGGGSQERQLERSSQLDAAPAQPGPLLQCGANVLVLIALFLSWLRQLQSPR